MALLEDILQHVETVERRRHVLDTAVAQTRATCRLLIAWGLARKGEAARAAELRERSRLPDADPVYRIVDFVLGLRIDDALAGRPFPASLPDRELAELGRDVDAFAVYKIERLRLYCRIIDPLTQANPLAFFQTGQSLLAPGEPIVDEPLSAEEAADLDRSLVNPQRGDTDRLLRLARRDSLHGGDLARYLRLWPSMTDKWNTNSHFSVAAIALVDILVFAFAREPFGPRVPFRALESETDRVAVLDSIAEAMLGVERDPTTRAIGQLMLAWAYARSGLPQRATELQTAALPDLDENYRHLKQRVEEALAGVPSVPHEDHAGAAWIIRQPAAGVPPKIGRRSPAQLGRFVDELRGTRDSIAALELLDALLFVLCRGDGS